MDRAGLDGNTTPPNGEISLVYLPDIDSGPVDAVTVETWDSTAFGGAPPAAADRHFFLTLTC